MPDDLFYEKIRPKRSEQFETRGSKFRGEQKFLLRRLGFALADIHDAHLATNHLLELCSVPVESSPRRIYMGHPLYTAMLNAICVSYAKPFVTNDGLGVLKKDWNTFDNVPFTQMHELLIRSRHSFYAHNDVGLRKFHLLAAGTPLPGNSGKLRSHVGYSIDSEWITVPQLYVIRNLTQYLVAKLQAEVEKLLESLYEGMTLPAPSIDLTRLLKGNDDDGF